MTTYITRNILPLLLTLMCLNTGFAQVQYQGRPIGTVTTDSPQLRSSSANTVVMPAFEIPSTNQDEEGIQQRAFTFAHPFEVNLNPENSGEWHTLDNGQKVWQLKIQSSNASSINVMFDKFLLAQGAQLFIYNSDMSHIIGAFTSDNNKPSGELPTMPVMGDEVIIELQEAKTSNSTLNIGQVNHDYTNVFAQLRVGDFGDAAECQKDATCYVDDIYQKTRRSTVKLIINGTELMSGTLINNTQQDGTPYVLTAAHGYEKFNYSASNTLFIFNYQVPQCFTDLEGTREQSIAGGTMRAYSPAISKEAIDFALVEMSVPPPTAYRPYYAGWNRSATPANTSFCIQHPRGDVKKISFEDDPLTITTLNTSELEYYPNGHWNVGEWEIGVTEGGSSGAGLFNTQGQCIGGLSAGASWCSNKRNDYFFRFDLAWNAYSDNDRQLAYWLDKDNEGTTELSAYESTDVSKTRRTTHINDSSDVTIIYDEQGYISGTNSRGIEMFAEKFENNETSTLLGFYFTAAEGSPSSIVDYTIWTGDDLPQNKVHKEALLIKEWVHTSTPPSGTIGGFYPKENLNMAENFILLENPIEITGNYFIGFEVNNESQDYPFGLLLSHTNSSDNAYYNDGEWKSYNQLEGYNKNTTLWIDPVIQSGFASDIKTPLGRELKTYPNPLKDGYLLTIETNGEAHPNIRVIDIMGRTCHYTIDAQTEDKIILNLEKLPQGNYIIQINNTSSLLLKL